MLASLWLSSFALFGAVAHVTSTERVRRSLLRAGPYIDIAAGAFFMVVGILLAVRGLFDAI